MKPIRALLSLMLVATMLFASTLPVSAIGFDAETTYESVFVIYSGDALGSGFAVGENCIVTNAHVIDNQNDIKIETYDGHEYTAILLGIDESEDLAALIIEEAAFPYLKMADLSAMKIGDDIYTIGAPKGMAYTLTKGTVSAKSRIIRYKSYIQIDAAINEGNSGGPLLNDNGEVLGMNTLKMSDSEGIGLAIPVSRVSDFLKSLGIETDSCGNVQSALELPEESTPVETPKQYDEDGYEGPNDGRNSQAVTYWAITVAALSLIVNIILGVLLIRQKKKIAALKYDPSERTDFEIDILE